MKLQKNETKVGLRYLYKQGCWNRKTKTLCHHFVVKTARCNDGLYYIKETEYCNFNKTMIESEVIQVSVSMVSREQFYAEGGINPKHKKYNLSSNPYFLQSYWAK